MLLCLQYLIFHFLPFFFLFIQDLHPFFHFFCFSFCCSGCCCCCCSIHFLLCLLAIHCLSVSLFLHRSVWLLASLASCWVVGTTLDRKSWSLSFFVSPFFTVHTNISTLVRFSCYVLLFFLFSSLCPRRRSRKKRRLIENKNSIYWKCYESGHKSALAKSPQPTNGKNSHKHRDKRTHTHTLTRSKTRNTFSMRNEIYISKNLGWN